ncbi:hypothetical protein chiPu_0019307, partial [Chiloscyllium punctatum]|nr:hypothetical protein [Chiloscyllium punctatum]
GGGGGIGNGRFVVRAPSAEFLRRRPEAQCEAGAQDI